MREMDSVIRVTHGISRGFVRHETIDVIKPKNDRVVLAVGKLVRCASEFSCGARLGVERAKGRTQNFKDSETYVRSLHSRMCDEAGTCVCVSWEGDTGGLLERTLG
jgi:hypothetical protein